MNGLFKYFDVLNYVVIGTTGVKEVACLNIYLL